jgi:anti-anti-sigma factor
MTDGSAMEIEERTEDDVTILVLKGRMRVGEADRLLRKKVKSLLEAGRVRVVLDMNDVPDIDSACLGEILHSQIKVGRVGGKLSLANLSEKLRSLLSRTRVAWLEEDDRDAH